MCNRCIRANKNNRGRIRFGFAKVLAHDLTHGVSVPLFTNRADNLAVEAHITRIRNAKTARRYKRKTTK